MVVSNTIQQLLLYIVATCANDRMPFGFPVNVPSWHVRMEASPFKVQPKLQWLMQISVSDSAEQPGCHPGWRLIESTSNEKRLHPASPTFSWVSWCPGPCCDRQRLSIGIHTNNIIEGSLEVKLPTIWTNEVQSRAEAERRERLEERRVEEKEQEERRCRCAKR